METLKNRNTAIEWFEGQTKTQKVSLFNKYAHLIFMGNERTYDTLTGREIERIWAEDKQESISDETMKMLSDAAREEMSEPSLVLTKTEQEEQVRFYLRRFSDLANSHFHDGNMEYHNYWKGQVMGMCKIVRFTDMNIDTDYYLKQLI
jgi:hypothetical protein